MTVSIVTLDEAKTFLNITSASFDAELSDFIDAASQLWVNRAGPVSGSPTYDERYDGGTTRIMLRHPPVQSVTYIHESYGSTITYTLTEQTLEAGGDVSAWGYSIDKASGLITRRAAGIAVPFAVGQRNIHVVYVAGMTTVPADVRHAVLLLINHMWETQRGGSKRPTGDDYRPGTGFMWPARVEEILQSQATYVPGIA